MVFSLIAAVFVLGIIPFCIGMYPVTFYEKEKQNIPFIFLHGYLIEIALFECLYVGFLVAGSTSAEWLSRVYGVLTLVLAVLFAVLGRSVLKDLFASKEKRKIQISIPMIVFMLLVAGQLVLRLLQQVSDGDDAFYVATATVSSQSAFMNYIQPYTGAYTPELDVRHALSGLPVWIAHLSRMTGIHAAIMCHCVLGVVFLLLHYIIVYRIGKQLFRENQEGVWLFGCVAAVFNIFGNVSLYTPQTFLLTRTWQGKTFFANLLIPMAFCLLLEMYSLEKDHKISMIYYIAVAALYFCAGACTTMGLVLLPALFVPAFVILSIKRKDRKVLGFGALSTLPVVALGLVFILL